MKGRRTGEDERGSSAHILFLTDNVSLVVNVLRCSYQPPIDPSPFPSLHPQSSDAPAERARSQCHITSHLPDLGDPKCTANAQCAMHNAQCTMPDAQCTMHNARCTMHNAQCTVHSAQCTMHNAPCTMHHAPCTVHDAQCTMHDAQCTMHSAAITMRMDLPTWMLSARNRSASERMQRYTRRRSFLSARSGGVKRSTSDTPHSRHSCKG